MSKNDVFVAVKTCQKFHSERGACALLPTLFEGQKQFNSLENITFCSGGRHIKILNLSKSSNINELIHL